MVRRAPLLLLPLLLAGCPGEFGRGLASTSVGLVAPAGLAGVPRGGSEIALTWIDRATEETGYRLEMNVAPFGAPVIAEFRLLPGNATSLLYPAFPNSTYYFRIFAVTATMESEPSNVIVVTTPDVPARPEGVLATTLSSSEIRLTWLDVANETGYVVQRSDDGGASWSPEIPLAAGTTVYPDRFLPENTTFAYRVLARNLNGDSTLSDPAFALTACSGMKTYVITSSGDLGRFASFAAGSAGSLHFSHYDAVNSSVVYSTPDNAGGFSTITVDAGPGGTEDVGGDGTSIAVDAAGKVHIVAHDRTHDSLRYSTNASGVWVAGTIDPGPGGSRPRIAIDGTTGTLHVLYQTVVPVLSPQLRHAVKRPGQPWDTSDLIHQTVQPGNVHSLTVDVHGRPHLGASNLQPAYALNLPALPAWVFQGVPVLSTPAQVDDTAVAADSTGAAHLVFHDAAAKALYHSSDSTGTWTTERIDQVPGLDLGRHCSVVVQPGSDRLHVAYFDATHQDLRYARKDPGGPWVVRLLDPAGNVGSHASIAVDAAGVVRIAYRDETNRRLKMAAGSP